MMRRLLAAGLLALTACGQPAQADSFDATIRELAAAHTHGTRDNDLPMIDRVQLLEDGDLVSFCGEVAGPADIILHLDGFKSHRIALMALTPDADGVYQGHQVLEVWHPQRQRWVVVDLDYGVMFDQTAASLRDGRVTPEWLETGHGDPEQSAGYPLVAQGVGRWVDGVVWFDAANYTPAERAAMESRGWRAA